MISRREMLVCILSWNLITHAYVLYDSFDVNSPTVLADPNFNVTAATRKLRHAMEGYGTNENDVISVLTSVDVHQRKLIRDTYKQLFKRDLLSDLKGELSGSFRNFAIALVDEPERVLAQDLHKAMKGWGTDEDTITEILACQHADNINVIASAYQDLYKTALESAIHSETSGSYRKLLHTLLTKHRGSVKDTPEKIAQLFVRAGNANGDSLAGFSKKGKMSENQLIDLLTTYSFEDTAAALAKFREVVGLKKDEPIHHGYSRDFGRALTTIVECAENRPRLYAIRLRKCFGRFRTDDRTLTRIVVLRSAIDLQAILKEYEHMYKDTLKNSVSKSVRGDLRHGIIALLGPHTPT